MESVLNEYYLKYSIPESGKKELIDIFNKSLISISEGIIRTKNSSNSINSSKTEKREKLESQRYASKKAEEYAKENNLSLSDFSTEKVSKKDVEELVRSQTRSKLTPERSKKSSSVKEEVKKEKVICSGLTKRGEICNRAGTHNPEGAKKHYCFRHSEDWKSFECDSDSSDSDSDTENEKVIENESENEKVIENESENENEYLFGKESDSD